LKKKIEDILDALSINISLRMEYKGKTILDDKLAKLLYLISEKGSILSASRSLGIPYSRAWERISRIEKILGVKIVNRRRGGVHGGGTSLTEEGKILLDFFLQKARHHRVGDFGDLKLLSQILRTDLVFAGSNDPILEEILYMFSTEFGYGVDIYWVGSTGGFLAIFLGEADLVGCHLLDPASGDYNIPYLQKYWLLDSVIVVRGFMREISLAHRDGLELNKVDDIIDKGYRIVNRNLGSGTRILLDLMIEDSAKRRGVSKLELIREINGYDVEVKTHYDVAKAIISGEADAGIVLTYIAEKHGLKHKSIKWEIYDLIIPVVAIKKDVVKEFIKFIRNKEVKKFINKHIGYKTLNDTGKIVYKPKHYKIKI